MLNIKRESAYADKLRAYQIELDDNLIGEIVDGESKSFDIAPGTHTLCIRIAWTRSKKISFESTQTKSTNFRCVSSLKGAKLVLTIVYALFLPHKYIELEQL